MWILQLLPDGLILWFTNLLLLVGIVLTVTGFFVHRIPLLYQYQLPFKIVGIALLAAGVYFRGGYGVEMAWRERVQELEQKLALSEEQSKKVNVEIREKVVYKNRVIREQGKTLTEYVDREIIKVVPEQCNRLPQEVIDVHNEAARMNQAIEQLRKDRK